MNKNVTLHQRRVGEMFEVRVKDLVSNRAIYKNSCSLNDKKAVQRILNDLKLKFDIKLDKVKNPGNEEITYYNFLK